ncbi:MAG: VOC family protein [Deltaproteobacteria bacterium]|nr:VOC family protein [Deltaproteobacteria bacterium]
MAGGRFVWHDLMTTDPEKSLVFLAEVLGLELLEAEVAPQMSYYLGALPDSEDDTVFGAMAIEAEEGQRSHWIGYLALDDYDAALEALTEAGGTIHIAPDEVLEDLPEDDDDEAVQAAVQLRNMVNRRMAIVTDPQGVAFAPSDRAPEDPAPGALAAVKHIGWSELLVDDVDAAVAFYEGFAGWQAGEPVERPGEGVTRTLAADGQVFALARPLQAGSPFPPHWVHYFRVEDLDATLVRAREAGGAIFEDPLPLDAGRRAIVLDPTGAPVGLWQPG